MKIKDLLFWEKIFVDKNGTYTGFKWWYHWTFAFWCLRKWLQYKGMPKNVIGLYKVLEWEKKISFGGNSSKSTIGLDDKPVIVIQTKSGQNWTFQQRDLDFVLKELKKYI